MRFLSADWVFPLHIDPIENGIIEISEKGEVVNILEGRNRSLFQNLEIFNGILCPGFVNAHCHLELSHLLGKLEKGGVSQIGRGILKEQLGIKFDDAHRRRKA